MNRSKDYISQLTWLRGFAAFVVVISHTIRATEVAYTSNEEVRVFALAKAFDLGSFGVILFFTLSGTTLLISSGGKLSSVIHFYIKRFFRIWPAFAVSLVAYLAFSYLFRLSYPNPQNHWVEYQFLADYTLSDLFSYFTLTFNINGTMRLFNNAYWSLPVEFQYYLIFPLLLVALRIGGALGPILIGGGLYAIFRNEWITFSSNDVFMLGYSFCGGVLLGHLYKKYNFRISASMGTAVLIVSFVLISMASGGILTLPDILFVGSIWNWFIIFSFVCVGVCLFCRFKLPKKLTALLELYGTISYSTYLYHNLIIAGLILLLIYLDINSGLARYLFVLFGTLLLTFPVAYYSYKWIELPFIHIGRQFTPMNISKPA